MCSFTVFNPPIHSKPPGAASLVWSIGCFLLLFVSTYYVWRSQGGHNSRLPHQLKANQSQIYRSVKPWLEIAIDRKVKRKVNALQLCKSIAVVKD